MKKIIKLAAAFAVFGAMLATVGCQQIYEDIDDINAELEQIQSTDIVMLRSEIQNCIADIAKLESAYKDDDAALKAEIIAAYQAADYQLMTNAEALATQLTIEYGEKMTALQNALNEAVEAFTKEISTLQGTDGTIGDEIKGLKDKDEVLAADILAAIKQFQGANAELKAADDAINLAISALESKMTVADAALKEELLASLKDSKDALEKAIAEQKSAFEKALAEQKDALEKAIAEQKAAFEKAASDSSAAYRKALEDQKAAIEKALADGDDALSLAISQLDAKLALEISGVEEDVAVKYAALMTEIGNRETSLKAADNTLKLAIAAGDSINARAIEDAKTALEGSLATAKSELEAAIENGIVGVNGRVDSLAGVTVKIASDLADLKTLVSDYEADIYAKIKADSAFANSLIDAIKTDYLEKYAELAGVDTDVQKTIDSLKGVFSTKIGELKTEDGNLNTAISGLRTEYEGKVAQFELELKKLSVADSATIARVDTLVAGVYARIAAVNDALVSSIAQALTDAKAYADAQIAALDFDNELGKIRKEVADSIKALREDYVNQVYGIDGKYKSIIDKILVRIQSIVAVPSAQYQIVSFTMGDVVTGGEQINATFEVLPKSAAEKITKANAQLHVKMALIPNATYYSAGPKNPVVKDTVLTGDAIKRVVVDANAGTVTVNAVLPTKKDDQGNTLTTNKQAVYFSLGVSDFEATYNEVQSEYVPATVKKYDLLSSEVCKWYVSDTVVTSLVDETSYVYCYNEGVKNLGYEATLKFAADFADGATLKNISELSEYIGDSLYVTYNVQGTTSGGQHITVALQDSSDVTYSTAFKFIPDSSTLNNYSIGSYTVSATPQLMSKVHGAIQIQQNLTWQANYEVAKFEHDAIYNLTNAWAFEKGKNFADSVVFAIDKADSAYFIVSDITGKNSQKQYTKRALTTTTSNVKITNSLADESKLMFLYRTAKFDSVAVKDTVTIPYDNGTNKGNVKLVITSGPAPVFRGTDSIACLDLETFKDSIMIDFNDVLPYYEGIADSAWTSFPANHDSVLFTHILNNKTGATYFAALKDTLKVLPVTNGSFKAFAKNMKANKLKYGTTYSDVFKVAFAITNTRANMFYEFPFSFTTIGSPFKVISTMNADSVLVGYLRSGDSLKYHYNDVDLASFYKVVWAKDSTIYDGVEKAKLKVQVTCGNSTASATVTDGLPKPNVLKFSGDSLIKNKTVIANTLYRAEELNNNEKCESKKFVSQSPITVFTIKDTLEKARPVAKADTIRLDGANGNVIKIEAKDITLENAWDSLKWEVQGEDLYGALEFIDNTDVMLNLTDRVVELDGIKQNVNGFEIKLDPSTQKPVVVISETAQKAEYRISVPYVANQYLGSEAMTGKFVITFTKQ